MFKNWKYITGRFISQDRTQVESLWLDTNGNTVRHICEADEKRDASYRELLTYVTLDQLYDNTWDWIKEVEGVIENRLLDIAKERGMILSIDNGISVELFKVMAKTMVSESITKEELFLFKLELFELPEIRSCKKRTLKSKLRKADTMLESLKAAIDIVESTRASSSTDSSD